MEASTCGSIPMAGLVRPGVVAMPCSSAVVIILWYFCIMALWSIHKLQSIWVCLKKHPSKKKNCWISHHMQGTKQWVLLFSLSQKWRSKYVFTWQLITNDCKSCPFEPTWLTALIISLRSGVTMWYAYFWPPKHRAIGFSLKHLSTNKQ